MIGVVIDLPLMLQKRRQFPRYPIRNCFYLYFCLFAHFFRSRVLTRISAAGA